MPIMAVRQDRPARKARDEKRAASILPAVYIFKTFNPLPTDSD
jgi:hypothetical protein